MNDNTYTTGELAKLCKVSTRTVQYYDKEGLVQPSLISEGGRRIYTDNDLQHFKLVCLYKELGFSLKDIKCILKTDNEYQVLSELITQQQNKLDMNIKDMLVLKKKLSTLVEEIAFNKSLSILNDEDLNQLIIKKEHHKKIDQRTYLLLGCYVIIVFLSCILGSILGQFYLYGALIINLLLLFLLIYFHSSQNAYLCSHCKKKFTITFIKDMFSLNNGKKGKYLKCPYCHQRNWIAETYKDY